MSLQTNTAIVNAGDYDLNIWYVDCSSTTTANITFDDTTSNCTGTVTFTYPHCCACAGACLHTTPPEYCWSHSPNVWVTPTPITPIIPYIPSPFTGPVFDIVRQCQLCEEDLEESPNSQICESCRETVKVFKEMFDVRGGIHRRKTKRKKAKK